MARAGRTANQDFEHLMGDVSEFGTPTTEANDEHGRRGRRERGGSSGGFSAALATLVSVIALAFSGYSFYETVLKQASLRFYPPPLVTMYPEDFRDVFAIPITISNDGAQRGTILPFDLEVTDKRTGNKMTFQSLFYGASPKDENKKMFVAITVAGRSCSRAS
jgi:hypothetical protein